MRVGKGASANLRDAIAAGIGAWIACAAPAHAATLSGSAGSDFYRGPNEQRTQSALGLVDAAFGTSDVLGGVMRFDDSIVGPGYGAVLGGGVALGGPTSIRALGIRFVGDRDYRAWRLKVGPQWSLAGGGTLGLFYVHDENNLVADTESGAGELSVPLAAGWSGKLAGAYGQSADVTGYSVSIGAGWTAISHLELAADVGLARNPPAATTGPNGGGLVGSLVGNRRDAPAPSEDRAAATTSLSLRVAFP